MMMVGLQKCRHWRCRFDYQAIWPPRARPAFRLLCALGVTEVSATYAYSRPEFYAASSYAEMAPADVADRQSHAG